MNICKVAFIGAGYMTQEHLKVFKDIENVELVGIFSRTKEKATKLANEYAIKYVADSITDLYEKVLPDLLVISVPELSTKNVIIECVKHDWILLIEKPVGYNLSDAKEIYTIIENHKTIAYVALNRRHFSSTRNALKQLEQINGKRVIIINDQEDVKAAFIHGQPQAVIDNWMFANSIHLIDFFNLFARGEIVKINNIEPWNENDKFFNISKIEYSSGDIGIYQSFWNTPSPWSLTIQTSEKRFEMKPIEELSIMDYGNRHSTFIPREEVDILYKPGLYIQAKLAVNAALLRSRVYSLPTVSESYKTMELISKLYNNVES
jgi:predicted dehydrogenase